MKKTTQQVYISTLISFMEYVYEQSINFNIPLVQVQVHQRFLSNWHKSTLKKCQVDQKVYKRKKAIDVDNIQYPPAALDKYFGSKDHLLLHKSRRYEQLLTTNIGKNELTDVLAQVICNNPARIGVITGMTRGELFNAEEQTGGSKLYMITVIDHKKKRECG